MEVIRYRSIVPKDDPYDDVPGLAASNAIYYQPQSGMEQV